MFDLDTRLVVSRVTYRLIRSLKDADKIEAAVRQILPDVRWLSSKLELIDDVGYREGAGHKLVSQPVAEELERQWRVDVRNASETQVSTDPEAFRVLYRARELAGQEPDFSVPDSPAVTLAVLQSAKTETRSQTAGSRAVRRSPRLPWNRLMQLFDGEEDFIARYDALKASDVALDLELAEVVEKYLGGWRPGDFAEAENEEE
jgi:hypothetical protein